MEKEEATKESENEIGAKTEELQKQRKEYFRGGREVTWLSAGCLEVV